jgi:hypothetical protein
MRRLQTQKTVKTDIRVSFIEGVSGLVVVIVRGQKGGKKMNDLISRQAVLDALMEILDRPNYAEFLYTDEICKALSTLPSAQPEQLTDAEQRIFLKAIEREEKVCKKVDEECRDCREPYEDSLVRVCHEIIRKVKAALWET